MVLAYTDMKCAAWNDAKAWTTNTLPVEGDEVVAKPWPPKPGTENSFTDACLVVDDDARLGGTYLYGWIIRI